jgi:hypothetical protein
LSGDDREKPGLRADASLETGSERVLAKTVFPDSAAARPMRGLVG